MTGKCPKCGYEPKKEYCQCGNLRVWDLVFLRDEDSPYCARCQKPIDKVKTEIILSGRI